MTKDQLKQLEKELWNAADNLRANSDLKSSEYAIPVLGLIFLKFADNNYPVSKKRVAFPFMLSLMISPVRCIMTAKLYGPRSALMVKAN